MTKGICYECPDRTPGCHAKCEKFLEFKQKNAEAEAEKQKAWFSDDQYYTFKRDNVARYKRRKGIK